MFNSVRWPQFQLPVTVIVHVVIRGTVEGCDFDHVDTTILTIFLNALTFPFGNYHTGLNTLGGYFWRDGWRGRQFDVVGVFGLVAFDPSVVVGVPTIGVMPICGEDGVVGVERGIIGR